MSLRKFFVFTVIVLLFGISIAGCTKAPTVNITQALTTADTKLTSGDLDGAKAEYEAALTADSTNSEANFGAGMLGILDVAVDENTRTLASKFGFTLPTNLNDLFSSTSTTSTSSIIKFSSFIRTATDPTITPGEVQTYVKNTLIPALDTALARLAIVEADPNFTYTLKASVTKGDRDRELDLGEIYALDVLGSLMNGGFHELISYDWDYTTSTPLNETNFGKLKSDGASNVGTARTSYIRAMTKWVSGLDYINSEMDDQTDDLIPQFPNPTDKDVWVNYINLVKNSLENGNTTFVLTSTKSIVVNLKAYYSSPISDWKVYVNGAINNFPTGYDFTINGLFPGMTTIADWNNLIL